MTSLIIAYGLIFVVLAGYGWSLYRRTSQVNDAMKRDEK